MYQYTLNLIKKLNPKQTILVTKYPEITKKIDPNIIVVPNYDTHLGQSHSMQLAIKASQQLSSADNTMIIILTAIYSSFATNHF